jgi:AsmA protein
LPETGWSGRRGWLIRAAGVVAVAGVLALAWQPWRLAEETVQRLVRQKLGDRLGLSVVAQSGSFALLPLPRVILHEVEVNGPDHGLVARVGRVRADLDLWALAQMQVAFDHVILFAAHIDLRLQGPAFNPLAVLAFAPPATAPATPRLSIRDNATVFFRSGESLVSTARDVGIEVQARERGGAIKAEGELVWRGERVTFALATDSAGRETLPMARLRSDLATLDFNARRGLAPGAPFEGSLQISSRATSRLGSWLSAGSPVLLPLGASSVQGQASLSADGVQLRSASVTLGDDTLEGTLDLRRRELRWLLTGTLAGRSLDIGRPQAGVETQRLAWPDLASTAPLDLSDLFAHDIDLRLSLQRVRAGAATLTDVAAQIMASEHRLDLALTNAQMYRGTARGRAQLQRNGGPIELRVQSTLERLDVGAFAQDVFEARRLTGQGQISQQVEMRGASPAELLASAQGRFALTIRNGDMMGANLADTMRRIERQPLAVGRDWRGGRTSFETMTAQGAIINGVMAFTEARMAGPGYALALDGQMSLSDRILRLTGQVASPTAPTVLPFEIAGPLAEPVVQINPSAFLERSGAVAPFLGR